MKIRSRRGPRCRRLSSRAPIASAEVEAVDEIEQRIGKPVVTSNQSSIWMTLRKLGHTAPIAGFGRLLRSLTPVAA